MCLTLAGYVPDWATRDARPIGKGARVPDRTYHGPMPALRHTAKDQRCRFCGVPGHNRATCPEIELLRNGRSDD